MNIVVLHGQNHHGSTWNITRLLLEGIATPADSVAEYNFSEFPHCTGCFACLLKGEQHCPHATLVQPIAQALTAADVIVLESPCYCYGITGQLKSFLDHLPYLWMVHRPHPDMFKKVGLVVSTAAGAGAKHTAKDLKRNLFYWGVPKTYRLSCNVRASSWERVPDAIRAKLQRKTAKLSRQVQAKVGHTRVSPVTKALFRLMGMNQKNSTWSEADHAHWENNGWLAGKKPW